MARRNSNRHYARSILIQLALVALALVLIIIWQWDLLSSLYAQNRVVGLGWVINLTIVVLFLLGMWVLVRQLLRYASEESDLAKFAGSYTDGAGDNRTDPLEGVSKDSLIAERYSQLASMFDRRAAINHSAMAATLVANESSQMGVPKFVNNVLILTGVLGTIVSLSIALLGATDLITTGSETGGLATVIGGMSTALSTTMSAIVAYLVFGYFYLRVLDAQTHFLGRIEDLSATYLVPRFQTSPDTLVNDYSRLLSTGTELIQRMDTTHKRFSNTAAEIELLLTELRARIADTHDSVQGVQKTMSEQLEHGKTTTQQLHALLREGFRLTEDKTSTRRPQP